MLFKYKAVDDKGTSKEGEIEAPNRDTAVGGLQNRGLIIVSIKDISDGKSFLESHFAAKVPMKDIVILSRQIATLFEAQVSALKAFTMLGSNAENKILGSKLNQMCEDLQAGVSISGALAKHPDVFSDFYVNMVKVGEETGKLNQTFIHLADYLDRQYQLTSKTKNALIYPAFVMGTFFVVMAMMFTVVIPKLGKIIREGGGEIPSFTNVVLNISDFLVKYGFIVIIALVLAGVWVFSMTKTEKGKQFLDRTKISAPVFGNLFRKLYLSRTADNLNTMLTSGIPIVRAIDITSDVVGSEVYKDILKNTAEGVKSGLPLSTAFEKYPFEIPGIMVQMVRVGEETGSLGNILKTLSDFYKREVDDAVDTMVGMIEPIMIVSLGLGVGVLLVSVLMPIYNMTGAA